MWVRKHKQTQIPAPQYEEYLFAVSEGFLDAKLSEGIWIIFFFILHCQSRNSRHWTNNPGLRLDRGMQSLTAERKSS